MTYEQLAHEWAQAELKRIDWIAKESEARRNRDEWKQIHCKSQIRYFEKFQAYVNEEMAALEAAGAA